MKPFIFVIVFLLIGCILVWFKGCDCTPAPVFNSGNVSEFFKSKVNKESRDVFVFIHGIFGDYKKTWKSPDFDKSFYEIVHQSEWFSYPDVITIGFNTEFKGSRMDIYELSKNVGTRLVQKHNINQYDRIYFVCHSMGGLITNVMLTSGHKQINIDKVKSLYYFAVPHQGAPIADYAQHLCHNEQLESMRSAESNQLLKKALDDINMLDIPLYAAYENRKTAGVMIVGQASAIAVNSEIPAEPIDRDHTTIVKPISDRDDSVLALEKWHYCTSTKLYNKRMKDVRQKFKLLEDDVNNLEIDMKEGKSHGELVMSMKMGLLQSYNAVRDIHYDGLGIPSKLKVYLTLYQTHSLFAQILKENNDLGVPGGKIAAALSRDFINKLESLIKLINGNDAINHSYFQNDKEHLEAIRNWLVKNELMESINRHKKLLNERFK